MEEAFATKGRKINRQRIHDQIGKGADNLVPTLIPGSGDALAEELGDKHGEIFQAKYLNVVKPFPGAHDLLARAHKAGKQVVLASSASRAELDHYLHLLHACELIATMVGIDDVGSSKPAPDIFFTALGKLDGINAEQVIAVGDTPYDVEAAGKCGIKTVSLRSGNFPDSALRNAGAIAIYHDAAALLAHFDASPLAY